MSELKPLVRAGLVASACVLVALLLFGIGEMFRAFAVFLLIAGLVVGAGVVWLASGELRVAGYLPLGRPQALALKDDGTPLELPLSHVLIAGVSGSGKSTFIGMLVEAMKADAAVESVLVIDLKGGVEGALMAGGKVRCVSELHEVEQELFEQVTEMGERNARMREAASTKMKGAVRFIVIDEAAQLTKDNWITLQKIAQQGRAANVFLVLSMQKATTDAIPSAVRDTIPGLRVAFRTTSAAGTQAVFGERLSGRDTNSRRLGLPGWLDPQKISAKTPGVAVYHDGARWGRLRVWPTAAVERVLDATGESDHEERGQAGA